ncbi:MAG TPA: hypothetical protein H9794_03085 [Candidatus Mediterraneibacter merdigallinarum]|nr:hypothetical protein [Candidatus Mediterraneibacter merdigallinarum]
MDYDFSSLNEMLSKFSDKIKTLPTSNLSPELLDALDNLSHSPQISSIQEMARKLQIYYSNLYNPDLTATAISQATSNALNINIPYDCDSINGAVSAMSSFAKSLSGLNTANLSIDKAVSAIGSVLESLDETSDCPEDDFITTIKRPIREFKIPDTLAPSTGHNQIRMKTDLFIALIGNIIIPLIFNFIGLIIDLNTAITEAKTETRRIEIEEERNELIEESNQLFSQYIDLLTSTDTSNSSKADQIESWKESLSKPDSAPATAGSDLDQCQENQNSNPE